LPINFSDEPRNSLRFVDIVNKKVHTIDLSKGPSSHKEFDVEHSIGTTADIEGNDKEFIFGGKYGYGIMNKDTGDVRWIKQMWTDAERMDDGGGKPGAGRNREERMRSNDGAVDPKGRYYVGAMNDSAIVSKYTDEGVLFRLDGDLTLHRTLEGITIPNGTSWSKDSRTMYFTDSPTQSVMAYPYNVETGQASYTEGKVFFKVEKGVPDGHCQDEEGCLWVANHGDWKVVRINPQGQIIAEVQLPTRCVTCPAFCGTELFITTMNELEPEKYPESTKLEGALFKIDVGVRGRPLNKFNMTVKA
jgi:sugar lactone lactonase YvrE